MEAKQKKRGRPRKNPITPPKPKGKRGRPRKDVVKFYDITTNQVTTLEKEVAKTVTSREEGFTNHLPKTSTFEFTVHDGNEGGKTTWDWKGDAAAGFEKLQNLYLTDKDFRDILTEIITGAIKLKGKKISKELESIV